MGVLAFKYPELSTLDLQQKAKASVKGMQTRHLTALPSRRTGSSVKGVNMKQVDTNPSNPKLFQWLARLGGVAKLVVRTKAGKQYEYDNSEGNNTCVLACDDASKRPTYSLRQEVFCPTETCQLCGNVCYRGKASRRHNVLCSKQRDNAQIHNSMENRVPVNLSFKTGRYVRRKTTSSKTLVDFYS